MISLKKTIKNILVGVLGFILLAIIINFWFIPTTNELLSANNDTVQALRSNVIAINLPIRVLDNINNQIEANDANLENVRLIEAFENNYEIILTMALEIKNYSEVIGDKLSEINTFSLNRHNNIATEALSILEDLQNHIDQIHDLTVESEIGHIHIDDLKFHETALNQSTESLIRVNQQLNQSILDDFTVVLNTLFISLILCVLFMSFGVLKYVTLDQQFILKSFNQMARNQFNFSTLPKTMVFFKEEREIYDSVKEIFNESQFVQRVKDIILRTYHIDDLIEKLFNMVSEQINIDRIGVAFVDYGKKKFVAEFGKAKYDQILLGPGFEANFDRTTLTSILETKTSFITSDLSVEHTKRPASASLLLLRKEGVMSNLVVPLLMGESVFGVVFLSSLEKDFFNEQHLKLAEKLIYEISGFLNRAYFTKIILSRITSGFSELVDQKDNETGNHIQRMVRYSTILAECLMESNIPGYDVDRKFILEIERNAASHDIGKVGIPDEILKKPGKLTPEEWVIMKSHVTIGSEIFRSFKEDLQVFEGDFYKFALEIARSHHERWDGSGYPDGLSDSDIPLSARIVAIADVFDALTSKRHYKEPFEFDHSVQIIKESAGSHLDPILVEVFLENIDRFKAIYERG